MAWIEAHDNLPDHPKTIASASALRIDKDAMTGKLWRFWTWALDNRPSGFISFADMETVAEKMRWMKKPEMLFSALCIAPEGYSYGFLVKADNGYMIHDWDVYTHRYLSQEEARKKDRERKRKVRDVPPEFQRNSTGNPEEETRNSVSYRNLTIEEERVREDEHGNPLEDPEQAKVSACYLHELGLLPGGTAEHDMRDYADELGADVVCRAIVQTNKAGARSPMPFLLKTLERWKAAGVRTVEQADAAIREHERNKGGSIRAPTGPPPSPTTKVIVYSDGTHEEVNST